MILSFSSSSPVQHQQRQKCMFFLTHFCMGTSWNFSVSLDTFLKVLDKLSASAAREMCHIFSANKFLTKRQNILASITFFIQWITTRIKGIQWNYQWHIFFVTGNSAFLPIFEISKQMILYLMTLAWINLTSQRLYMLVRKGNRLLVRKLKNWCTTKNCQHQHFDQAGCHKITPLITRSFCGLWSFKISHNDQRPMIIILAQNSLFGLKFVLPLLFYTQHLSDFKALL